MNKYLATHIYPIFYFLFWLSIHFMFLGYDMLIYSIYISLAYAIGHFLAARDGKIALSSDGTAMPLTALAGILYALLSWYLGHFPSEPEITKHIGSGIVQSLTFSYMGAHIGLSALVLIYDKYLAIKNNKKI